MRAGLSYYQVARFAAPSALIIGNTILLKHFECPKGVGGDIGAVFVDMSF